MRSATHLQDMGVTPIYHSEHKLVAEFHLVSWKSLTALKGVYCHQALHQVSGNMTSSVEMKLGEYKDSLICKVG